MHVKDSLAFFFYKDGARGLRFIKRLELSDVVSRLQDDLITFLGEEDLSHITLTIVGEMGMTNSNSFNLLDHLMDTKKKNERLP